MDIKRAWNRPVVRSTYRGFSHCPIQLNRQRQSPRRYELCTIPLETYINNGVMPHIRAQHMLTRSHGRVNKITPGTSTVATFKTGFEILREFLQVSNTASSKRLLYVLEITSHPKPPCCYFGIGMPEVQLGSA